MNKLRKRKYFEIRCPNCEHSFWTDNVFNYFRTEGKNCPECSVKLNSGMTGMNEQILIYLRNKAFLRAIHLVQFANPTSHLKAKHYVEKIADDNNIRLNTDVSVYVNFFVRLVLSALIGFAIIGIGSIYFPNIQKIAGPFVCTGNFSIEADKFNMIKTEKEGEYGVVMFAYCTDSDGVSHDITKKTFYAASIVYASIVFLLFYLFSFIKYVRRLKKATGDMIDEE